MSMIKGYVSDAGRLHPIEDGGVDLGPERFAVGLADHDIERLTGALDRQLDLGRIGQQLPADDVADGVAADAEDLVAGDQPRPVGR